jgi:linoleoyl-CoA desaturase
LVSKLTHPTVTFAKNIGFRKALNKRVDQYFSTNQIKPRDNPAMYLKTAIITAWTLVAWAVILVGPPLIGLKILGCIALGVGVAGFGMSVGHDANHGGYSSSPLVNRCIGFCYDIIGVSSFLWKFRHNQLHHVYTNLDGYDAEIQGDGVVRMSPHTEHQPHHRFQHLWIWLIYPFIPFYWYIRDTQRVLFNQDYQEQAIPPMQHSDYLVFWGGRCLGLLFLVGIPLAMGYSFFEVALGLSIAYMTYGAIVCEVFMLAHVVESVEFPKPNPESHQIEDEWAIFQMKTTADFAPHNPLLNWYIGGLNYQAIHHLFPQVCHIHYPQLAPIVAEVCEEFGVNYCVYPTLRAAIASNYRWLRRMAIGDEV